MSTTTPYQDAQKAFLTNLTTEDQVEIGISVLTSAQDVITTLEHLVNKRSRKGGLLRYVDIFKELNDRLVPYFDALNTIATTNNLAAWIYGAFRLVIQMASAFPTFLDKFMSIVQYLSNVFPQYEAILKVLNGEYEPRLRRHFELVYTDLLELFQAAAKVFMASDGKIKRPVTLITNAIWRPSNSRFSQLLDRMKSHQTFIMNEVKIFMVVQSKDNAKSSDHRSSLIRDSLERLQVLSEDMQSTIHEQSKASVVRRLLEWLDPPPYAQALEDSQDKRGENTSQWVFEEPTFKRWLACEGTATAHVTSKEREMTPQVLWIHGNPGCGKTVLASAIVDYLKGHQEFQTPSNLVTYFFFKYGDRLCSSLSAAYRSVLAQFLHQNQHNTNILDRFLFAQYEPSLASGQRVATENDLKDLLRILATGNGPLYIIIDGLDEASDSKKALGLLEDLVTWGWVKLICLSRTNIIDLLCRVPESNRIAIRRESTSPDIRMVLTRQLTEMYKQRKLPADSDVSDLVESLVLGADGMFLWAALMAGFLNSPALTPNRRIKTIQGVRFPEGLDTMYDRIVKLISHSASPERSLARRILLWVRYSRGACWAQMLETCVKDPEDEDEFDEFPAVAVSVCCGLVESVLGAFRFSHLTVKEFLDSNPWSRLNLDSPLLPPWHIAQIDIVQRCLEYLCWAAPDIAPTRKLQDDRLWERTFEAYAARNWTKHLTEISASQLSMLYGSDSTKIALDTMQTFSNTGLAVAYWIECLHRAPFTHQGTLLPAAREWTREAEIHINSDKSMHSVKPIIRGLYGLFDQLISLETDWERKLNQDPSLIWDDILVFQKKGVLSQIEQPYRGSTKLVTLEPSAARDTVRPNLHHICTVSAASRDGSIIGVLSAYCSIDFKERFSLQNEGPDPSVTRQFEGPYNLRSSFLQWRPTGYLCPQAERFSVGWAVIYEWWDAENKTRLASHHIDLPEKEVAALLRQSFRCRKQRHNSSFHMSFPMAISPDCLSLSILRTVYSFQISPSRGPLQCIPAVLDLNFLRHYEEHWTSKPSNDQDCQAGGSEEWDSAPLEDTYIYSIVFSPNGIYLSFIDHRKPALARDMLLAHLAIFSVSNYPEISVLKWTTMVTLGTNRMESEAFHPSQPLIAYLGSRKVWLWNFQTAARPVHVPMDYDECSEDGVSGLCVIHKCNIANCVYKSLSFSACGRYIIARTPTFSAVSDVSLFWNTDNPGKHLGQSRANHATQLEQTDTSGLQRMNDQLGLVGSTLRPGELINQSPIVTNENGDTGLLTISSANQNITVDLSRGPLSRPERSLQLLTIPASFDTRDTAISVRVPEAGEETVRLIMNKTPSEFFELNGRRMGFPSVTERNIGSLHEVTPMHLLEGEGASQYIYTYVDPEDLAGDNADDEDPGREEKEEG
ncbi:hypothetical protein J7T55_000655 [Diaporthe amygdali]|uniref:uncharacterized protein n=1 Tax=Phomopsis amygdali TaxID=1214568 RepID=UPI0022FED113|nr:uncharacterized protein J7T55_000655 [Diaporthe amygdali]KAJ0110223.1 hypothetical protein J7T55_000655 [Diaporthe amygdali]